MNAIRALSRSQQGQALIMTIGFLCVGTALVAAALALASTASIASRLATQNLKSQYAAMAGSEHAIYRLVHDPGYADSLPKGIPTEYTITVGGEAVLVTVLKHANPPPPPEIPPTIHGYEFHATKTVEPSTADPYIPTTYTYTITITNMDNETETLKSIWDRLPSGFTYVSGSSIGISSQDPALVSGVLKWDLGPHFVDFQAGESKTQTFQAQASVGTGNYGNEAWVEPGGGKTSSGMTAKVTVGSPPSTLWEGAHATIEKTVDPTIVPAETPVTVNYTIIFTSTGNQVLTLTAVKDFLPVGGLLYVPGTTTGLTTQDPSTTMKPTPEGDRQQLEWRPNITIQPGEQKSLSYQASGTLIPGDYYSEVWATFQQIPDDLYTWPTARFTAMGVFDTTAWDGKNTVSSQVWIDQGKAWVATWEVRVG